MRKLKIWFDALTPKQLLLFNEISKNNRALGHDTIITTRNYREITGIMKLKKIKAIIIGRYGGKELKDKLLASTKRMELLTHLISDWMPDVSISFASPEASRVAFGLGIPHYVVNDSPHAYFPLKLSLPLAKLLFTPWIIPKKAWEKYGIKPDRIITYKALDPVAWLINFQPDRSHLERIGISLDKKIILIRETETFASYLLGQNITSPTPTTDFLLHKLTKVIRNSDFQFVILPRYEEQIEYLMKKYSGWKNVIILNTVVDGASLIYYSDIIIGGGGTMSIEGALLGKIVISTFPQKVYCLEFLRKRKLLFRFNSILEIINFVKDVINNDDFKEKLKERSKKLWKEMVNPAEFISKKILADFLNER